MLYICKININIMNKIDDKKSQQKKDIRKKFSDMLVGLTIYVDEKSDCEYEKLCDLYDNDSDLLEINEKLKKFIDIINDMNIDERKIFIERDIETDIWYIL